MSHLTIWATSQGSPTILAHQEDHSEKAFDFYFLFTAALPPRQALGSLKEIIRNLQLFS